MKQTAVEWYHEEIESIEYRFRSREINFEKMRSLTKDALEKAKEMEKKQIIEAHLCMDIDGYFHQDMEDGEIYYNETFKSE